MSLADKSIESLSRRISELEKLLSNLNCRSLGFSQWTVALVQIVQGVAVQRGPFGVSVTTTRVNPGGFYYVRKASGTADTAGSHANAGANLTMPEGMVLANQEDQHYLINLAENGSSSQGLKTNSWHIAVKVGEYRNRPTGKYCTQDILAIDIDTGPQLAKILSSYAYFGASVGGGRYKMALGKGAVTALDATTNFHNSDNAITFGTDPDSVGVNLFEGGSGTSGTAVVAANRIVTCFYRGVDNGNPALPVYYFDTAPTGAIFRVNLTQNGGSNGNKSYQASYAYDVTSLDGLQLASAVQPERIRPKGAMTAATMGTGYLDKTGAFILAEAWETPGTGACS